MITSGSVFDEDKSGIKRWTDGLFRSPSHILANFLLYREADKPDAGHDRGNADPSFRGGGDGATEGGGGVGDGSARPCW